MHQCWLTSAQLEQRLLIWVLLSFGDGKLAYCLDSCSVFKGRRFSFRCHNGKQDAEPLQPLQACRWKTSKQKKEKAISCRSEDMWIVGHPHWQSIKYDPRFSLASVVSSLLYFELVCQTVTGWYFINPAAVQCWVWCIISPVVLCLAILIGNAVWNKTRTMGIREQYKVINSHVLPHP